MGSGGMIVMDEGTCMVDVAKYFMKFLADESCGNCFVCRKGTQRMHELLDDITKGEGTLEHLDLLEELACVVRDASLCGLGQTASNPVLSTLRYFREEYLEHIQEKHCRGAVCKELITFFINDRCQGCRACSKVCPEDAITGEKKHRQQIDTSKCIKCGACRDVCRFGAAVAR
jgi:NADP-reducing hydrogenase subunit HndC